MDFSRGYTTPSFNAVVIPLETSSKMWYFKDPFTYTVWLLIVTSMPVYIFAMGMAYYLCSGSADWDMLCGFVIRNALSEQNDRIPDQAKAYQKLLIITWLCFTLVLVQAYAGSLTAMLAKPQFHSPIKTLEELLRQNEISWVIEKGTLAEFYMRTASPGTTMNLLHKQAELVTPLTPSEIATHGCYAAKLRGKGRFGSFCEVMGIWPMFANDFSTTGKCNFYLVEERLISTIPGAAFQVNAIGYCKYDHNLFFRVEFQKGSPFLEDFNNLVDLKDQMGLEFSEDGIEDFLPNSTKCMTWQDVKASHETDTTLVITIKDIFGIMILLALGLGGAMLALGMEFFTTPIISRSKKTTPIRKQAWTNGTHVP